jgi:hypothetical protein
MFYQLIACVDEIFCIMSGWNKHFGQLAHKSNNEKFDIKFLELIEKESEIITQICEEKFIHKEVTIEEFFSFFNNFLNYF